MTAPAVDRTHEQELIASAKSGSRHAYGELVSLHWEPTTSLVYHLYGDPALAEEAAQEAFIRGWQKIGSFQEERPFKSWISRIAINTAIDLLRKRQPEIGIDDVPLVSRSESPEESVERQERAEIVRKAVLSLPVESRSALVLREYVGLSYAEISEALSVPLGTVMSRLNYARSQMRNKLAAYLEE